MITAPVFISLFTASFRATQPPVIAAQRVPPSAWITSQSIVIWRSPSATRSTPARNERPIKRWISTVRPPCFPAVASRRIRLVVERGSIPYSAVTHPRPEPFTNGGTRSSSVAVQRTCVSPTLIMQEPSACFVTFVSMVTSRIWSRLRPEGRITKSFCCSRWDTRPNPYNTSPIDLSERVVL